MILPTDICKCTGSTQEGVKCGIRQDCKRYLSYTLDDEVYVPVMNAPNCIEHTPLECPVKISASLK